MLRLRLFGLILALTACATPPPTKLSQPPTPTRASAPAPASSPKLAIPDLLAPRDTPAALDPKHPLHIGEEYYPVESRKQGEEGTCVVRLQIDTDGTIRATQLLTSTGFPRLNAACLSSTIDGRLIPATVGGKPTVSWFIFRVNWRLSGLTFKNVPRIRDDYQLKVGADDYPPLSRKLHQEGDCIVHVTVDQDGPPSTVTLTKSTGYDPLDQACITAVRQAQFIASRQDPGIVTASTDIGITWRLPFP